MISLKHFISFYLLFLARLDIGAAREKPKISPSSTIMHQKVGKIAIINCNLQEGSPPIQFEWSKNSQSVQKSSSITIFSTELSSTLTVKSLKLDDSGNYSCKAINDYGIDTFTTKLEVEGPPEWLAKPGDMQIGPNEPIAVQCKGIGYPIPRIVWKKQEGSKWQNLFDTETSFHKTSEVEIGAHKLFKKDEGKYACELFNGIEPRLWTEFQVKLSGR